METKKTTLKRSLRIRTSDKKRKRVKQFAYDVAQFCSLLLMFEEKYNEHFKRYILNESVLYSLIAEQTRKKTPEQEEALRETKERIAQYQDLQELIQRKKEQKTKVDNNYILETVIRGVVNSYRSYLSSTKEYKENLERFKGKPKPPKPKKLNTLTQITMEFNRNIFKIGGYYG